MTGAPSAIRWPMKTIKMKRTSTMKRTVKMKTMLISLLSVCAVLAASAPASAQLVAAGDAPVAMGHVHLYVPDIDTHKRFWVDTLGGQAMTFATSRTTYVQFHNVILLLSERDDAPGGTTGSVVDHIGFQVPSVSVVVERLKAAGYLMVTREALAADVQVTDDIGFVQDHDTSVAVVMGPNDVKVELVETSTLPQPIAMHHLHFAAPDVEEMRDWYVTTFGATAGRHGSFEAAELGGVSLLFSPASGPVATPEGRVLDHFGFEITNILGFYERFEAGGATPGGAGCDTDEKRWPTYRTAGPAGALPLTVGWMTGPGCVPLELTEGFGDEAQFTAAP